MLYSIFKFQAVCLFSKILQRNDTLDEIQVITC